MEDTGDGAPTRPTLASSHWERDGGRACSRGQTPEERVRPRVQSWGRQARALIKGANSGADRADA
jgi:hypothetical protein